MGIRIDLAPEEVPRCLEEVGCAFLFAPAYHTTLRGHRAGAARAGGGRVSGPFSICSGRCSIRRGPMRGWSAFSSGSTSRFITEGARTHGCPRFTVACGEDEESRQMIGEVSAQGTTLFGSTLRLPTARTLTSMNSDARSRRSHEKLDSLLVRNARRKRSRLEAIFSGEDQGLDRETLLINAAVASWTHGTAASLEEGHGAKRAKRSNSGAGASKRAQALAEIFRRGSRTMSDYSAMRPFIGFAYNIVGLELMLHRIRIEGRENVPPGGCLIVSNHVSYMDPTTVGWAVAREIYYLGRKSLFKPPFWSWFLPMSTCCPSTGTATTSRACAGSSRC